MANQTHPFPRDRAEGLSPTLARLLEKASAALSRREPDVAETALIGVLALAPDCVEAQRLLGVTQQARGDHPQAVMILRQALALRPGDALIHMNLGVSLHAGGDPEAALASFRQACALAPDLAAAWFNLGRMFKLRARPAEACEALERALRLAPTHLTARLVLAEVQTSLGEVALATANYRELLRRHPGHPDAWIALANLKVERFSREDVSQLRRALQPTGLTVDARVSLGFALAKALEDQEHYPAAFAALRQANSLKRRHLHWDAVAARAEVDAILDAFARPVSAVPEPQAGEEVIFIVSLPRSGSTLAEQILASHPQVEGADELTDLQQVIDAESARRGQTFPHWVPSATAADWARLGQDYLARTEHHRRRRPRFTDKNLINWQFVGAAMAMLPGARVVNCRRDPLESCFGCYRQLFVSGNLFSYNLGEMASRWSDYDRLSRHWQALYPHRFFEHAYESLLAEPEAQTRRLLEFCGLDYDPACLQFHRTQRAVRTASAAQVRQPLRRDTARSARYGDQLGGLRALLRGAHPAG